MAGITVTEQTVDGDPDGEWWFRYDYRHHNYGVQARHGHQFDAWNYGGGHDRNTREAHLQVPLGDVIATEFAVGLVWEAQQRRDALSEALIERLQDVDNVRPLSRLLEWLYYEIEQHDAYRDELDAIADAATKNLLEVPFVRRWRSPLSSFDERLRVIPGLSGVADWLEKFGAPGPDDLGRLVTNAPNRWIFNKMLDMTDANTVLQFLLFFLGAQGQRGPDEADPFLQAAFREHVWRRYPDIHMILYGHTHQPGTWPLEANEEREVLYINTGTWRERIQRTVALDAQADFMTLKQMTYVVVYGAEENGGWEGGNKQPDTPSFDMWTGTKLKHYR
jgi:G:T-mismatch repair DNA endonuclease (very short patch repair protein)